MKNDYEEHLPDDIFECYDNNTVTELYKFCLTNEHAELCENPKTSSEKELIIDK